MRTNVVTSTEASYANSQQDLMRIAANKRPLLEREEVEHLVCSLGLVESEENLSRMSEETFKGFILNLMKSRPTTWDLEIKPEEGEIKEVTFISNSEDFYRRSFGERAAILSHEFAKNPRIAGLRILSENIPYYDPARGPINSGPPGVSVLLYLVDKPLDSGIPVKISRLYRVEK